MQAVIVRNLPEAVHRALKARAARNGRSTEAELRDIIVSTVSPPNRVGLGSALAAIGRDIGGAELDLDRDRTPAVPMSFD